EPEPAAAAGRAKTALSGGGAADGMFTSGATGGPKGVGATPEGGAGGGVGGGWGGGPGGRGVVHAPPGFGGSTDEIWVPLLSGAAVVVAPFGTVDGAVLAALDLTVVHVTAGLLGVLAEESPECFAGVREVLTGGDVVSPAAVALIRAACPEV